MLPLVGRRGGLHEAVDALPFVRRQASVAEPYGFAARFGSDSARRSRSRCLDTARQPHELSPGRRSRPHTDLGPDLDTPARRPGRPQERSLVRMRHSPRRCAPKRPGRLMGASTTSTCRGPGDWEVNPRSLWRTPARGHERRESPTRIQSSTTAPVEQMASRGVRRSQRRIPEGAGRVYS
jgi:hypothetical protein